MSSNLYSTIPVSGNIFITCSKKYIKNPMNLLGFGSIKVFLRVFYGLTFIINDLLE